MVVHFPPFHADLSDERLWHGAQPVHLTRKAWGVLRALLEANGRLVTKDQLAERVWHGTYVGDDSLTKVVRELRRALGDDQRAPRFIATVHGRGYRFVAPVGSAVEESAPPRSAPASDATLIGRERELSILTSWLDAVLQGRREVGFVSGEVGIGKSSLVHAFLAAAGQNESSPAHIAAGQCVEQYGEAEPFLPVITALRRLCRAAPVAAVMRQAAPSWLATSCGLAPRAGTADAVGTRAGVLRTLAEVIEAIANAAPLVFVLEDLHWSDPSTLDLVNLLARRPDPARLLVVCTLRRADALAAGHRSALLVRELRRTRLCRQIALEGLAQADVDRYLAARLAGGDPPPRAGAYLLRHTGGNPFFLAALIDDLIARGSLTRTGTRWGLQADEAPAIPSRSLAALAPRLERLSASERGMLEAASVAGDVFSAETVAAAIAAEGEERAPLEPIESLCERMVRHQDVLRAGENGAPYAFRHALYRQALYDGIPPARRRRMHGRVGESLAAARSPGSAEGAAELAAHFARAGDHSQAASYHAQAAEAARARFADREVAAHLSAALAHLRRSPCTAERDGYELALLPQHAAALLAANGFGDPQVADAYRRLQTLARRLDMPLAQFGASAGLLLFHLMRAELDAAASLAGELTAAAPGLPLPECAAAARAATAAILFSRGDLIGARQLLDGLHGVFPRREPGSPLDAATWYLGILSMVDADLGESAAARATCADLLAGAHGGGPFDIASGHMLVAVVEAQLRNPPLVLEHAETACRIAAEYDAPMLVASAAQLRAWAMAAMGAGAGAALSDRETAWRAGGQWLGQPFFAVLRAETSLCADDRVAAEAVIAAGLEHAQATGEHRQDSNLHRLRAECLRRSGRIDAAAAALDLAFDIAAAQGARLAELRAAIDSFRIHRATSRSAGAAKRLAAVTASFDDRASLPELSAASALLRSDSQLPKPARIPLASSTEESGLSG